MTRAAVARGAAVTAVAVVAGVLVTAGLPPFGWWPLASGGVAILDRLLAGQRGRARFGIGYATGLGVFVPGLWWMGEFSAPGAVIAILASAGLFAIGPVLAGSSRIRWLALPAALALIDALRGAFPFEGVPVATVAQTQIGGPLMEAARLGGPLLVAALVGAGGVALSATAARAWWPAAGAVAVVVVGTAGGMVAPRGNLTGHLDVALVQGGGERGTRAIETGKAGVFEAHVEATADVDRGVDIILWPEDVVDVVGPVLRSERAEILAALARRRDVVLVAGAVEGARDRFRNLAVAWDPDGSIAGVYEKEVRVPFGEWIPFRSVIERVADVSAVPRDATVGDGPGLLATAAGDLGVVISWEVFFPRRTRAAVNAGGEVLLAPTNTTSFSTTQMPAIELQVARLRAVEVGRWTLLAAPTGFTGVIDNNGNLLEHSDLGPRAVLHATVERRAGRTPYGAMGDLPLIAVAAAIVIAAGILDQRGVGVRPGQPA